MLPIWFCVAVLIVAVALTRTVERSGLHLGACFSEIDTNKDWQNEGATTTAALGAPVSSSSSPDALGTFTSSFFSGNNEVAFPPGDSEAGSGKWR